MPKAPATPSSDETPVDDSARDTKPTRPSLLSSVDEQRLADIRNHRTRFPERTKRAVVIAADKGGVGKSTWLTQLVQFYVEAYPNVRVRAFDPDDTNRTLLSLQPEHTTYIDVSRPDALDLPIGQLIEDKIDVAVLDGLGSLQTKTFVRWTNEVKFYEMAATYKIAPTYVLLLEQDADTVRQSTNMIERIGNQVDWLVVRNYKQGDNLSLWDNCKARERVLGELGGVEVCFPKVSERLCDFVAEFRLPYAVAGEDMRIDIFNRSRFQAMSGEMSAWFAAVRNILLPGKGSSAAA